MINYLQGKYHVIINSMRTVIVALIVAILFRSFVFEPFRIPSSSMYPALKVNDFIIVSKFSYGFSKHSLPWSMPLIEGRIFFSQPERGDIVVFKLPDHPKRFFVKRLIGMPGDRIELRRGEVILNGVRLEHQYEGPLSKVERYVEYANYVRQYKETLPNNVSYDIWTLDGIVDKYAFPNTTREYIVPEGYYFFMGDNRDNSVDSRYSNDIGMVNRDNLIGKVVFLHFSLNNFARSFSIPK